MKPVFSGSLILEHFHKFIEYGSPGAIFDAEQGPNIGLDNGLSPIRRQAII